MTILILVIILSQYNIPYVYASDSPTFARIMKDNVCFYRSPTNIDESSNIYFDLPKTYFVELLDNANADFYQARYMNIIGYVKKESVQAVASTPTSPYLSNTTFRVYANLSQNLRTSPNKTETNLIVNIPILTRNILLIGKINGECLIEGRTNQWFYCRYVGDKIYEGYVYSDFCDEISPQIDNTEEVTYIPNPTFEETPTKTTLSIDDNLVGVIIGILSIPALIFFIMIIRSKKILSINSQNEVIDYYKRTDL